MAPEFSRTINITFPYLLMEGGKAKLIREKGGQIYITALAKSMQTTSKNIETSLKEGKVIHFDWADEKPVS